MFPDPTVAAARVTEALDEMQIDYLIGGSLASSVYGAPRMTEDVDIVAHLREEHVDALVDRLGDDFYADADMIRDAIRRCSSFNVIHWPTSSKVDVFIPAVAARAREELVRRRSQQISLGEETFTFPLCSPEDIVLHKLEWYRAGGGVSDRQWSDVLGVLKVQWKTLDEEYLRRWARELGLVDLLDRALSEAEPEEESEPRP